MSEKIVTLATATDAYHFRRIDVVDFEQKRFHCYDEARGMELDGRYHPLPRKIVETGRDGTALIVHDTWTGQKTRIEGQLSQRRP